MNEVKNKIIEQAVNKLFYIFRGERAVLLYMTLGTILFFKNLVTQRYNPPISFPHFSFFIGDL
ncbi:hypothetical protein SDC9_102342 [bioreactor metagenome]|uniref:Uncharacterized protein n=1 Tax=bioreactor metagenome TaxID=1076179 RepID=A0A645AQK4_9ZZZZ